MAFGGDVEDKICVEHCWREGIGADIWDCAGMDGGVAAENCVCNRVWGAFCCGGAIGPAT